MEVDGEDGEGWLCEEATESDRENATGCGALVSLKGRGRARDDDGGDDSGEGEGEGEEEEGEGQKENRRIVPPIKPKAVAPRGRSLKAKAKVTSLLPSSLPRPSSLSSSASSLREKVKAQAMARLASSSVDLDDHLSLSSLNSDALLSGQLCVQRAPLMSSLSIKGEENPLSDGYRRPSSAPASVGSRPRRRPR